MLYFNKLDYGEGIAGPATIGIGTTAIYSCMGIALVNTVLQFGGLYHYPAERLHDGEVTRTIIQMLNDIAADAIYLTPAADVYAASGSSPNDIRAVSNFLEVNSMVPVTVLPATNCAILHWEDGEPVLNTRPTGRDKVRVAPFIRSRHCDGHRTLLADIWYYGGQPSSRPGLVRDMGQGGGGSNG